MEEIQEILKLGFLMFMFVCAITCTHAHFQLPWFYKKKPDEVKSLMSKYWQFFVVRGFMSHKSIYASCLKTNLVKSEDIKSKKNRASRAPIDRQLHLTCLLCELRPSVSDFPNYLLNAVYFSLLSNNLKTVIKQMFVEYMLYFAN